jgi:hypothetical protein
MPKSAKISPKSNSFGIFGMPPRTGISLFSNNVKVYMWSRCQGSCSLFILPKKDFGRSLLFSVSMKRPLLVLKNKLYWEWRICLWISTDLVMGNIIYLDDPHFYWACDFDEVYLTQQGPWIKWCTIHGYLKYLFAKVPKLCCPPWA